MQLPASAGAASPAQVCSCASGSAGPITAAPVIHAERCKPASPSHSTFRYSGESTSIPAGRLSTKARYQQGRTNAVGWNILGATTAQYVRLIRGCETFGRATRPACYRWLGTALAVVTDGRFGEEGCSQLAAGQARSKCLAGASSMEGALVTLS
jgi:hypothetical protein